MSHPLHSAWFRASFAGVVLVLSSCSAPPTKDATPQPAKTSAIKPPTPLTKFAQTPQVPVPTAYLDLKFERPAKIKGIYLTAWSAGSKHHMQGVYNMFTKTIFNSVVIDIRDLGEMYWKTGIPLAAEAGANEYGVLKPKELMSDLKAHGIYPIARIACFRDNYVPKKHPELGVQTPDGKVWHDRPGNSWLDPYNKKNWDYLAATVEFALSQGFPEIQLDYVRFPSEIKSPKVFPGKKTYSDPNAKPEDVISAFADFIREKVKAHNAYLSADIFGIISSTKGDEGIGQELDKIAKPFDTMSPMVYPSHFAAGEYGVKFPNASPYEILMKSFHDYQKRLPGKDLRPWLQDFTIPVARQPHVHYGVAEVQAQIKAAHDNGYDEFLMWNAGNKYTEAAYLKPKSPTATAGK